MPFRWESLRGWDFRPQLIAVLGLSSQPLLFSWWNSGYQKAFFHELSFFHDGILAIRKPFSRTFSFSRWISGYQEAFLTNLFFFMMEFWLSGSLSHELFIFHVGILAMRKPFSRTFSFSRWNSRNTRFGGRLFLYISQRVFT
jgi:hypothetical protein